MNANEDMPQYRTWFSASLPVNVDDLFTFRDQCAHSSGALFTTGGDTMRASSTVGQQETFCVDSCQYDLQVASGVCEGVSNDLTALTGAVSKLAWSIRSVRDEHRGITQTAKGCSLVVVGDKVILFDESDDDLIHGFNELQAQAEVQRLNYERAEHMFSLALDNLRVGVYEQWIEPVSGALKKQLILDNKHPLAKTFPYAVGLSDVGEWIAIRGSMTYFRRLHELPKGFLVEGDPSK